MQDAARAFAERAAALARFQAQLGTAPWMRPWRETFRTGCRCRPPEADLHQIADQMNDLLQGVEAALAETSDVLMRIAKGDLSARISGDYQGVLLDLKRDTNATANSCARS